MASLGPHHVLFVTADPAQADFAEKLLTGWGLHVSIAKSGQEAFEFTKTHIYDLILIASHLGDMEGYQTAHIIRRLGDQFQQLPIVGYGLEPMNSKEHELTDFITIPFDETVVYDKLKNHLDKTRPDIVMANLDRCTDGDPEFRKELAQLLANNITELMTNIEKALEVNDPNIFIRAVHKTKTTLSILNDVELIGEINIIQTKLKEPAPVDLNRHVENMSIRCKKTINVLNEISALK